MYSYKLLIQLDTKWELDKYDANDSVFVLLRNYAARNDSKYYVLKIQQPKWN